MTTVVAAQPVHVDAIAALLEELDMFYGDTSVEPLDVRVRQINEALFGDPPLAYAVLAWDAETLVGLATYSVLWPAAGLTRSLYLKELYVVETARGAASGSSSWTASSRWRPRTPAAGSSGPPIATTRRRGASTRSSVSRRTPTRSSTGLRASFFRRQMPGKGASLTVMVAGDAR